MFQLTFNNIPCFSRITYSDKQSRAGQAIRVSKSRKNRADVAPLLQTPIQVWSFCLHLHTDEYSNGLFVHWEFSQVCMFDEECPCSMWSRNGTSEIWRWRWDPPFSYRGLKPRFVVGEIEPCVPTAHSQIPSVRRTWPEQRFLCVRLVQELVELVLTDVDMRPGTGAGVDAPHTCLEVGCGSGAIALSLLKSLPQVRFGFIVTNWPPGTAPLVHQCNTCKYWMDCHWIWSTRSWSPEAADSESPGCFSRSRFSLFTISACDICTPFSFYGPQMLYVCYSWLFLKWHPLGWQLGFWVKTIFGSDVHVPCRMNLNNFGNPLIFNLYQYQTHLRFSLV